MEPALFKLRKALHEVIDPWWQAEGIDRVAIYQALKEHMGAPRDAVHAKHMTAAEIRHLLAHRDAIKERAAAITLGHDREFAKLSGSELKLLGACGATDGAVFDQHARPDRGDVRAHARCVRRLERRGYVYAPDPDRPRYRVTRKGAEALRYRARRRADAVALPPPPKRG